MLWIIEGSDIPKKNSIFQKITDKVSPDSVLRFDSVTEEVRSFKDSQDIFGEKRLIIVGVTPTSEFQDDIDSFNSSETAFVIQVDKLLAPDKKKLADITCFSCHPDTKAVEKFNMFSFSDALVTRNKKDLWVLYQKATRLGVSPQEIINILLWQAKSMLVAGKSTQADSGLKPFVYNKSKKAFQKYTLDEVVRFTQDLIAIYHNSRRGDDLSIGLEKLLLSL